MRPGDVLVTRAEAAAYRIPTDAPESDGTIEWDSTTLVVCEVSAADQKGIGYTYADATAAQLIRTRLAAEVVGLDAMAVPSAWMAMNRAVRNLGRPGVAATAISAVDSALWDLKARLLNVSLASLFGPVRDGVPVYGSGGFTSYSINQLQKQLAGWVSEGIGRVKMKVGRQPDQDPARVRAARAAIGSWAQLFVDGNGAYHRKQALQLAHEFAIERVAWFEEPVTSDDLEGLRLLRDRVPLGMEVAAGEYGYDSYYFERMIAAGAVDCLQADATRCGGLSGFARVGALCEARDVPLSAHTAPSLHLPICLSLPAVRHIEWFHDHVRIEQMLFDGAPRPVEGVLRPDRTRPGLGLQLKRPDAERYRI